MAAYPAALKIGDGSAMVQKDDLTIDRAVNGAARGRAYFSARKREFTLRHNYATQAECDALLAFYDANRVLAITMVWVDGTTYTCIFASAPSTAPVIGALWQLESKLVEI